MMPSVTATSNDPARRQRPLLDPDLKPARREVLLLEGLTKSYGELRPALAEVSFHVEHGEFVCILGPSGSGKTTLLRLLAGFMPPDSGRIVANGSDITHQPAQRRGFGVVFQNYALFPGMTAYENVAFPLKARRVSKKELGPRVEGALALVGLASHAHKRPSELSGGQQQRVALARALVYEPTLLLLDEPLASLDRRMRQALQIEIRTVQQELNIAAIFVTHDQEEAMAMADRIAVLHEGRLEALGRPYDLYERPPTAFVASFLGDANFFEGAVSRRDRGDIWVTLGRNEVRLNRTRFGEIPVGTHLRFMVRPEYMVANGRNASDDSAALIGCVTERVFLGGRFRIWVRSEVLQQTIIADVSEVWPEPGDEVELSWAPEKAWVIECGPAIDPQPKSGGKADGVGKHSLRSQRRMEDEVA